MTMVHKAVLTDDVLKYLSVCRAGICVDCTLGEGGHSRAILERLKPQRLVALEADAAILANARQNLGDFANVTFINDNFVRLAGLLKEQKIEGVNAILMDLGVSLYHYRESGRGFSFDRDEPLDMRIDTRSPLTADEVVNSYPPEKLKQIFWAYGEERWTSLIVRVIVERRQKAAIRTSKELADLVSSVIPKKFHAKIHPATRVFQAIRIEVNNELDNLEQVIDGAAGCLVKGGRLAIISFHSLEDRIVKHRFQALAEGRIVDEVRGTRAEADYKILTKKPVEAREAEKNDNPSARSAKLRVLERVRAG